MGEGEREGGGERGIEREEEGIRRRRKDPAGVREAASFASKIVAK